MYLLFCFIFVNLGIQHTTAGNNESMEIFDVAIPIAVMLPLPHVDGNCTRAAIDMAISDVNSVNSFITHTNIHRTKRDVYKLQPLYTYTSSSTAEAIESLHSSFKKSKVFATIGPPFNQQVQYCSEYTTANANNQISYSEASEPIDNYYVMYHQISPSITSSFATVAHLLTTYNWTRIGVIYDYSDRRYRKNANTVRDIITSKNNKAKEIEILSEQGIWSIPASYSVTKELGTIQNEGIRIIIALVGVEGARKIFCEAYKRKMYRPKVIWILFETLPQGWETDKYNSYKTSTGNQREISCTEKELKIAASGYISITKKSIRNDNKETISKMNARQFEERLQKFLVNQNFKCDDNVAYAYDSVWLLGLGSKQMALNNNLSCYDYEDYEFSMKLTQQIKLTNFEGLTGNIKFNDFFSSRLRLGLISIWMNFEGNEKQLFGSYDDFTSTLSLLPNATEILFGSDGAIPKDRAVYFISFVEFDHSVRTVLWLFATAGIVLSMIFMGMLGHLMRTRIGCLETPIVDFIMIFGCIVCYSSVIVYGVDTHYISKKNISNICTSFLWILSIGFTLTFGALFSKTWGIYKQYMTPGFKLTDAIKRKTKPPPEWSLLVIIAIFIMGDVIILCVWTRYSPFHENVNNITTQVSQFDDVIKIEQIVNCSCANQTHFSIGIYCYKGLLLIFGIFLAWQTRYAKLKVKKNSKEISMAIYNIVVVSAIGVICVSVLASTHKYQAVFTIIGVCIIICTTSTLLFAFLSKIRRLLSTPGTSTSTRSLNKNRDTHTGKYTLEYMRKPIQICDKTKEIFSNSTLATEITLNESPNIENIDIVSALQTTSDSSQTSYQIITKTKLKKLDSGIYVGSSSEEEESRTSEEVENIMVDSVVEIEQPVD